MTNPTTELLALHDANMKAISEAIRAAGGDPTIVLYNDKLPLMHILAQNNIRLNATYSKE